VIGRGEEPGTFYLYNKVNFLRGREVMKEEQADTNEKKLYLAIQLLYLFPEDTAETSKKFETVLAHCLADRPDRAAEMDQVARFVRERDYYRALKLTAKLF
ncbi:MAG: flagellar biosynthesis repressor FlbT, partial [Dongiaceae bacterium]